MHTPTIFVIIVHYGDSRPTLKLVRQLREGGFARESIVVVDHAVEPLPMTVDARMVRPQQNGGYGAGVNVGLGFLYGRQAHRDDVVVVLNSDAAAPADLLDRLRRLQPDLGGLVVAGVRGGVVDLRTGRAHLVPAQRAVWHKRRGYTLPYIHGMCLVMRLETFMRMHGMAEDFFMYWEDVLLSWRVLEAGGRLLVRDDLGVDHDETFKQESWRTYYRVRNGALFLEHYGPRLVRPWWWTMNRLRTPYHRYVSGKRAVWQGLRDAQQGVRGKREAL